MSITVSKSRVRPFLVFCLKLVNAGEDDREFVVKEAAQAGTLDDLKDFLGLNDKQLSTMITMVSFDSLVCNVNAFAELLTLGKSFFVEHESLNFLDVDDNGEIVSTNQSRLKGVIRYFHRDPEQKQIICPSSTLWDAFYSAMLQYKEARNLNFFDVPLKICKQCGKTFFGQKPDQQFCNKTHAQRWHAKATYEKKTAQAKP